MEKQSTNAKRDRCTRLLIVLIFYCFSPVFSQNNDALSDLQFMEIETEPYALERTFIIELEDVTPSRIRTEMPSLGEAISVLEFNKTPATVNGGHGTRFTLVIKFGHAGVWDLPEILFSIDGQQTNNMQFYLPEIKIEENPANLKPNSFYVASESTLQGQKTAVILMVQNCSQVLAIKNNLNTDSLFDLVQIYKPLPYTILEPLGEEFAIAEYNFVALEEGRLFIPSVQIAIVTRSGEQRTIVSEPLEIAVTAAVIISQNNTVEAPFNSSELFLNGVDDEVLPDVAVLNTKELVQGVLDTVVLQLKIVKIIRKIVALIVVFCVVITTVLFCLRKKQKMRFLVLVFIGLFAVCLLSIPVLKRRAVCYYTKLQTIPEIDASSRGLIENGTIVTIKRKSSDWYLIELSDNRSGWIPCEKCIDIK